MLHYWSLEAASLENSWLTIGSFDGVHLGHQEIIRSLTAGAHSEGAPAVVLTFYPHPAVVLGKRQDPFYLTSPEERAALLGQLGVDIIVTHPFNTQLAGTSAWDFVKMLKERLGLRRLLAGQDFALGRGREGNIPSLQKIGLELDFVVQVVSSIKAGEQSVSSSLIRTALGAGDVEQAQRLLGRPYQIRGEVIHGDGRGRTLGIPTANLDIWAARALPKAGVYACQAHVGQASWGAVTNVGVRPTFEIQPVRPRVEAHLLNFDRNLYGEQIRLEFIARLRDEQRFPDLQALVAQIQQDIRRGQEILSGP